MSSLADILRQKQTTRKNENSKVKELAALRAKLARQKRIDVSKIEGYDPCGDLW